MKRTQKSISATYEIDVHTNLQQYPSLLGLYHLGTEIHTVGVCLGWKWTWKITGTHAGKIAVFTACDVEVGQDMKWYACSDK